MAGISEIVRLNTGYASAVNLREEFLDPDMNRGRMERYMPVKSHRDAFYRLTGAIAPGSRERCFLLTGNFGTGKSHLLLMLANYMHSKSTDPDVAGFLDNWQTVEPERVERLRALRREGHWMVAVCDFSTTDDFGEVVLRAIAEACEPGRENFPGILETHYREALNLLDSWKAEEQGGGARLAKYTAFEAALLEVNPDYTMNSFRTALKEHRQEAMTAFKQVHRQLLNVEFSPNKANLVQILKDFTGSAAFKERYAGLLILFDEFGYVLENKRVTMNVWQNFAEFCNSGSRGCQPCIFIAAAHKSFETYARGFQDFAHESDRIKEVSLKADGIEDIIGSIVSQDKSSDAWVTEVLPRENVLNGFAMECHRVGIFSGLSAPEVTEKISKGSYPMHPMSTYCLLQLAQEIGSNNRTAFTFFSGGDVAEVGSFPWFINNHDILDGQKLRLYTVDLLRDYFAREMSSSNRELRDALMKQVLNYEASLRDFNKLVAQDLITDEQQIAEVERVMKAILVCQLVNVPATLDNIAFGLFYTTPGEKNRLDHLLRELDNKRVLFLHRIRREYEFKSAESIDVGKLIEDYVSTEANRPPDLAAQMVGVAIDRSWPDGRELISPRRTASLRDGDLMLPASGHNSTYSEDKRARRIFATPEQLAARQTRQVVTQAGTGPITQDKQMSFFEALEFDLKNVADFKDRYEAVCVYVLCETPLEIERATTAASQNESDVVLLAIPREPMPVTEAIMNLRATTAIMASSEYDQQYTASDRAHLADLHGDAHNGYQGIFYTLRQRYLDGREATWYGKSGRSLVARPSIAHEALDKVMGELYNKRNKVPHADFNYLHNYSVQDGRSMKGKVQLKDAAQELLSVHRDIDIDASFGDDKGQIRYLRSVLLNHGVLRQSGAASGNVLRCVVEPDESKYAGKFPALADMEREIKSLAPEGRLMMRDLVARYSSPPYGLGPISLALFLACLVRGLGDEMMIKRDEMSVGEVTITSFDQLVDLLSCREAGTHIRRRPMSQEQRDLLNSIHATFTGQVAAVGDVHSLGETVGVLRMWWDELPAACKIRSRYSDSSDAIALRLIDAMERSSSFEAFDFVFRQLQLVCGRAEDDLIDSASVAIIAGALDAAKSSIELAVEALKSGLLNEIRALFSVSGTTYQDCLTGISEWYSGLDANQRDQNAPWHSGGSKSLLRRLGTIDSLETTLFDMIPSDPEFGLGKVQSWSTDKSEDYVLRFRDAKLLIESNAIKVPDPEISCGVGAELISTDGKLQVLYNGQSCFVVESPGDGVVVLVCDASETPTSPDAQVQKVSATQSLALNGGNRAYRLVSRDADGNLGRVMTVECVDRNQKYSIAPPTQRVLPGQDKTVLVVLPPDAGAFRVSIRSFVDTAINESALDKSDVGTVLRSIAGELEAEQDQ